MGVLKEYCDRLEVYSIDEAFLILNKYSERSFFLRAEGIKKMIKNIESVHGQAR